MDVKVIPGTQGFTASMDGVIRDSQGNIKNQYTNGDGYKTVAVYTDKKRWQTFGVHRLVALAHIPCEGNVDLLVVNHLDFNKLNNHASNLEWTTDELNNIHAALFRGNHSKPSIIARSPSGKHEFIANIQTASKRFGLDQSMIWDNIRHQSLIDGWLLMFYGKDGKIPKDLHKAKMNGHRTKGILASKSIDVLHIPSQTVQTFQSFHEAAKYFQTHASHLFRALCSEKAKRVFKGTYMVVRSGQSFPSLSQVEFEQLISARGKEVIAYNEDQGKIVVYESAGKFIKENGLSKKAVTVDLKKGRLRRINGWWYIYNTPENNARLKTIINHPGI